MSRYECGWTWGPEATEDQMTPANTALVEKYVEEIRALYDSIPDTDSDYHSERAAEAFDAFVEAAYDEAHGLGLRGPEASAYVDKVISARTNEATAARTLIWDKIEFFEAKLNDLNARFREPYEHWNEDAQRVQLLESMSHESL